MYKILLTYFAFIISIFAEELCLQKFTVENGLPQSSVISLYEDKLGYIWIGTQDGIARYNGYSFTYYKTKDGLPEGNTFCIYQTSKGYYYFATAKGLALFDGNKIKNMSKDFQLTNVDTRSVVEDDNGNLWISTAGKGILKWDNKKITYLNTSNNFFSNIVRMIYKDKKNNLWFLSGSSDNGLCKYDGKEFKVYTTKNGLISNKVFSIYEKQNGEIIIGTDKGLSIIKSNNTIVNIKNYLLNVPILSIVEDLKGKLFIATWGNGLIIIDNNNFRQYTTNNGLLSNNIWSLLKDRRGDIWIGTENGGLNKFSAEQITFYSEKSGLKSNSIYSIYEKNNVLYLASYSGVGVLNNNNNKIKYITISDGLTSNEIYSFTDYNNKIFVGTSNNISILDKNRIYQINIDKLKDIPVYHIFTKNKLLYALTPTGVLIFEINKDKYNYIKTILTDIETYNVVENNDTLWFCTNNGLYNYIENTNKIKHYTTTNGLPSNTIFMGANNQHKQLFFATPNGLVLYENHQFKTFTTDDGLSNNYCYSVYSKDDYIFVGTNYGLNICKFKNKKLIFNKILSQKDGLPSNEFNQNSLFISNGNILWAGTVKGLIRYNLNNIPNKIIPEVYLTYLKLNNTYQSITDYIELDYKQGRLDIGFISVFYGSKVKYFYKLEGLDDDWISTENPEIIYPTLPFGSYKLFIKTINSDGLTTEPKLLLTIYVHPPFYMQLWFILTSLVGLFALTFVVYQYKTYQIKKRNIILEKLVQERTYQLQLEKEKSENLLLNILPASVVDELKVKGYAEPKQYDSVSIMFTDFKGFTQISSGLTVKQLVEELNDIFKNFDEIIAKHQIEKIKTIGDSYMVCSGVPVEREDHAIVIIKCAFEMLAYLEQRAKQKNIKWQMRVGIHSGSVMAGVVGLKKFTFDIWGDTVNIASRMESSGVPGSINISEATYNLIKDHFECEYRGKVEAKGKGLMDMYLVNNYLTKN